MQHIHHPFQIFLLSWNTLLVVAAGSPSENRSRAVNLVSILLQSQNQIIRTFFRLKSNGDVVMLSCIFKPFEIDILATNSLAPSLRI